MFLSQCSLKYTFNIIPFFSSFMKKKKRLKVWKYPELKRGS